MTSLRGHCLVALGLAVGMAAFGPPASASPITVTFMGLGPSVNNAGQMNWNTGSTAYSGIQYTAPVTPLHFVTFCTERGQTIAPGTYTDYQFENLTATPLPGPVMSAATAVDIRMMWAEFRDDVNTGSAADVANKSAAFQQAVWHLLDASYNPSLSGAVLTYYDTFRTSSNWHSGLANLASLVHPLHQDQIVELQAGFGVINNNVQQVPEPATLVVGLLLAPAVLLRRRK
jgi:hypothetical protein